MPLRNDLSGLAPRDPGALVLAWGAHDFGQLGVGPETRDARERGRLDGWQISPQILPVLSGRPVADVACGALFDDACNRCRRLGLECVPREMAAPGSRAHTCAIVW